MKGELRGSEEKREKRLTEEEGRKRGIEGREIQYFNPWLI